jgi:hypothetical protein
VRNLPSSPDGKTQRSPCGPAFRVAEVLDVVVPSLERVILHGNQVYVAANGQGYCIPEAPNAEAVASLTYPEQQVSQQARTVAGSFR